MQQIYVLLTILMLLLGFGVVMHQTQYQNVRQKNDLNIAKSLDKLDPAAGISYKSSEISYNGSINNFNGRKIFLTR